MKFATVTAAATVALAATSAPIEASPALRALTPGQWQPIDLTPELQALLVNSLRYLPGYRPGLNKLVCVQSVQSISKQQVSGTNYLYQTMTCPVRNFNEVGHCQHDCLAAPTQIQLNINVGTNTWEVNRIETI